MPVSFVHLHSVLLALSLVLGLGNAKADSRPQSRLNIRSQAIQPHVRAVVPNSVDAPPESIPERLQRYAGKSSGGGGNICRILAPSGQPVDILFDLVGPNGVSEVFNSQGVSLAQSTRPGTQITFTDTEALYGFKRWTSRLFFPPALEREVRFHLEKIAPSPLREDLLSVVEYLGFMATSHEFAAPSRVHYEAVDWCNLSNTRAVVYYNDYLALVSAPVWNSLSLETQSHVLVHEAIRMFQGRYDIDDLGLQQMTRIILTFSPSSSRRHLTSQAFRGIRTSSGRSILSILDRHGRTFNVDAQMAHLHESGAATLSLLNYSLTRLGEVHLCENPAVYSRDSRCPETRERLLRDIAPLLQSPVRL